MTTKSFDINTGKRTTDGVLIIRFFSPTMLSLERARCSDAAGPTLLTSAQATELRNALDELIPQLATESPSSERTGGGMRRVDDRAA